MDGPVALQSARFMFAMLVAAGYSTNARPVMEPFKLQSTFEILTRFFREFDHDRDRKSRWAGHCHEGRSPSIRDTPC